MDGKDNDDDGLIDEDHDKVSFDRLTKKMNAIIFAGVIVALYKHQSCCDFDLTRESHLARTKKATIFPR